MAGNAPEVPRLEVAEQRRLVLSLTEPEMIAGHSFVNRERLTRPRVLCAGDLMQFAILGIDLTFE